MPAYVAASFARSGLTPLGVDGTWLQPYVLARPVLGEGTALRREVRRARSR